MALNFPASPTVGQTYVYATTGTTWTWNGSSWSILSSGNFSSITVTGNILPSANATYNIGSVTSQFADIYGTAYRARYADLAERYESDAQYEIGTVMVFGGENEVTQSTEYAQTSIAGVVSDNPALCMNAFSGPDETHPYIALQGRIPVKVTGIVKKGDILVSSYIDGYAVAWDDKDNDPRMTAYIGIAIGDKNDDGAGFVEVKVGK